VADRRHCIFRVPPHFKVIHGNVFTPQTVSLGPFHHGRSAALRSMEEHKRRAVRHLLRRAGNGNTARDLAAAVEAVAGELEDMYDEEGLGSEWRSGVESRGRFLELMVTDGCFLLEVMWRRFDDYAPGDPVFSRHAAAHIVAFVQRDMLMVENQLPLLVLLKIASVVVVPTPVIKLAHLFVFVSDADRAGCREHDDLKNLGCMIRTRPRSTRRCSSSWA
jgi:hypothetical protein